MLLYLPNYEKLAAVLTDNAESWCPHKNIYDKNQKLALKKEICEKEIPEIVYNLEKM